MMDGGGHIMMDGGAYITMDEGGHTILEGAVIPFERPALISSRTAPSLQYGRAGQFMMDRVLIPCWIGWP